MKNFKVGDRVKLKTNWEDLQIYNKTRFEVYYRLSKKPYFIIDGMNLSGWHKPCILTTDLVDMRFQIDFDLIEHFDYMDVI